MGLRQGVAISRLGIGDPSCLSECELIWAGWQRMAILVLCLKPENLLDPNDAFAGFANRLTISPVVERLVFSKVLCWKPLQRYRLPANVHV